MSSAEHVITFKCHDDTLLGILHLPAQPHARVGVLIVVGGPQYRVGSHRQFVLMARAFADAGWPVFRFDYRGMGDSSGPGHTFEEVQDDIAAARAAFMRHCQALRGIVLWGLCDAASAAMMYAAADPCVRGLVIANPWVRTATGEARTYLRHYYVRRLLQRSFWRKVISGEFNPAKSANEFAGMVAEAGKGQRGAGLGAGNFIDRMRTGLSQFKRSTLLLISENDLTAQEFIDVCTRDRRWEVLIGSSAVQTERLAGADHTFSDRHSLTNASQACLIWLAQFKG